MTRRCTVCGHPASFEINEALVLEGVSYRDAAGRYGLSKSALQRHYRHIPELLSRAQDRLEIAGADALMVRIESWTSRIETALVAVEEQRDYAQFFRGISALRPYLELFGEITKELERRPEVNIVISTEAQHAIVNALAAYPEARGEVISALAELEAGRWRTG